MQKFGLVQETYPDRVPLTWVVSLVEVPLGWCQGGQRSWMQRGAPCHTVPLDSIAVSLQGALSARSLLAQSGPLEYAEEALHW